MSAVRLLIALALAVGLACSSKPPPPPEICLTIEASENLNLYDREPHVVVVYFYPLQNLTAYRQTDPVELRDGKRPPGMTGDAWESVVLPGTRRELRESLPRDTQFIGILADFYNGPRQTDVRAECRMFGRSSVILSASDVQVK